jgi:transcriptional regulator with XRE-family HTH domain
MQAVARYIEDLRTFGGLKGTDVANIANVSPPTVSRWLAGTHYPHPKTQLVLSDLHYIVNRLKEYYTSEEIRVWLYALHPQLEGQRAIDLITAGESEAVIAILDRLDSEAYL